MATKKTKIQLELLKFVTDRHQYKPYMAELGGNGKVFVEIELADDQVISSSDGKWVITTDGLAALMSQTADAIDTAHNKFVDKQYNR